MPSDVIFSWARGSAVSHWPPKRSAVAAYTASYADKPHEWASSAALSRISCPRVCLGDNHRKIALPMPSYCCTSLNFASTTERSSPAPRRILAANEPSWRSIPSKRCSGLAEVQSSRSAAWIAETITLPNSSSGAGKPGTFAAGAARRSFIPSHTAISANSKGGVGTCPSFSISTQGNKIGRR